VLSSLTATCCLRDENGKGTTGCGSGMGLLWGLVLRCEGKGNVRRKNMPFCLACGIRYYFKDIRQGEPQFDCVMFVGGMLG